MRRPGITLVEVLVAIFVMGIGMIALLTLFPLGALRMAQAVKDDRTAIAAANAAATAKIWGIQKNNLYWQNSATNAGNLYSNPETPPVKFQPRTTSGQPSYFIYIDPLGSATFLQPVGGTSGNIKRYPAPNPAPPQPFSARWFSLLDDVSFQ